jgi:hypothetical protein
MPAPVSASLNQPRQLSCGSRLAFSGAWRTLLPPQKSIYNCGTRVATA